MTPADLQVAESYRTAGLSYRVIGRMLGYSHTHVRLTLESAEPEQFLPADPEHRLDEARWRCPCSRINTGPARCPGCGWQVKWARANDRQQVVIDQLTEECR